MDAYDMPAEFKNLQGLDMGRLGFIQDLTHRIDKIFGKTAAAQIAPAQQTDSSLNAEAENLLKRGFMALEDKNWDEADRFFEDVLNKNAEEPRAYRGKLLAKYKLSTLEFKEDRRFSRRRFVFDFEKEKLYQKALRFGDANLQAKIEKLKEELIRRDERIAKENELTKERIKEEVQQLEKEYWEIQEKIDRYQISEKLQEKLSVLQEQIQEATNKITQFENERDEIQHHIINNEAKLTSLGIFHRKEKKSLHQQIDNENVKLHSVSQQIEDVKREKKILEKKKEQLTETDKKDYVTPLREKQERLLWKITTEYGHNSPEAQKLLASLKPAQDVNIPRESASQANVGSHIVKSPMPGIITSIKVKVGEQVQPSTVMVILEAMKMENEIFAGVSGKIANIYVSAGNSVNTGDALVSIC